MKEQRRGVQVWIFLKYSLAVKVMKYKIQAFMTHKFWILEYFKGGIAGVNKKRPRGGEPGKI